MPYLLLPDRPAVMGVLNVTPDSFSDGGQFLEADDAVRRAEEMTAQGADIVDVGGESTRPGAPSVSLEEEKRRVLPVVRAVARLGITISIDTSKAEVAAACLDEGAQIVNDVTALRDPAMAEICAISGCTVCLMHMKGDPRTMQASPTYADVVGEVRAFLTERAENAMRAGVSKDRIWIDPGIGFGKTVAHNLSLIAHVEEFVETGYPVLVGVSMKSFIGKVLGSEESPLLASERLEGTLAAQCYAQIKGARIVRTHAVKETVRCVSLLRALAQSR